jgi:hypothetical protein
MIARPVGDRDQVAHTLLDLIHFASIRRGAAGVALSAWLQKLDAECPYQIVLPRRQLTDDHHGLRAVAVRWQIRHVRRRRMCRVRALLLRGPDGRGDFPVAL